MEGGQGQKKKSGQLQPKVSGSQHSSGKMKTAPGNCAPDVGKSTRGASLRSLPRGG